MQKSETNAQHSIQIAIGPADLKKTRRAAMQASLTTGNMEQDRKLNILRNRKKSCTSDARITFSSVLRAVTAVCRAVLTHQRIAQPPP